jgi:pimeloyl-ACP methyl ester carboxylesterase
VRKRSWVLLASASLLLVGPFLVPVNSSGTVANDSLVTSGSFVKTGEYRTHVVEVPDLKNQENVFVLLHGFGASAASWNAISEALSELGEVVAYDRPAFGLTDRPTSWTGVNPYSSDGALEQLDAVVRLYSASEKDVYLVGHSAGAMVATQYILDNPDSVDGLILVAPAVLTGGGAPSWLNWLFYVPQINHLGPLLVSGIAQSGLQILEDSYFDPSLITSETLAAYQQPLQIAGWERAFWEFNRAKRDYDANERLAEVRVKTLVITGDSDKIVDPADSTKIHELIANSRLAVLQDLGHLPHEENPSLFMATLRENWSWISE